MARLLLILFVSLFGAQGTALPPLRLQRPPVGRAVFPAAASHPDQAPGGRAPASSIRQRVASFLRRRLGAWASPADTPLALLPRGVPEDELARSLDTLHRAMGGLVHVRTDGETRVRCAHNVCRATLRPRGPCPANVAAAALDVAAASTRHMRVRLLPQPPARPRHCAFALSCSRARRRRATACVSPKNPQDLKISFDGMGFYTQISVSYDKRSGVLTVHGDDGDDEGADARSVNLPESTRAVAVPGVSKPELILAETEPGGCVVVTVPLEAQAPAARRAARKQRLEVRVVSGPPAGPFQLLTSPGLPPLARERQLHAAGELLELRPLSPAICSAEELAQFAQRAARSNGHGRRSMRLGHRLSEKAHADFNRLCARVQEENAELTKAQVLEAVIEYFVAQVGLAADDD